MLQSKHPLDLSATMSHAKYRYMHINFALYHEDKQPNMLT